MKKYLLKVKKLVFLLFLLYGLISLVNIFTPIVNAGLLTNLTNFNLDKVYKYGIAFLVVTLLGVLINHGAIRTLRVVQERLLFEIRFDLINRLFKLKTKNFDLVSSGEFQERIKNDPEDIFSVFSVIQYNIFNVITETIILIYTVILSPCLGLVYIIGLIIIYLYEKKAYKRLEEISKEVKRQREKNGTILNEILHGIRDIKLLGITNKMTKIASEALDKQSKLDTVASMSRAKIFNVVDVIKALLTAAIVFVGIVLIKNNLLTLTSFLIVFFYRSEIFSLLFSYTSLKEYLIKYKVAKGRIDELFNEKKFPVEKYGDVTLKNIKGEVEFKNVSFGYKNKEVIHDISFKIKPLENVALVGKSGSGKSTIFNLLTKSYDDYDGIIMIDGVDIKRLNKKSINDNISIISQNPYIFNMSIKDNLKIINRSLTDNDIMEACKVAKIHDYIESLPDKYNTLIGEGGVNLSGGQKQRLAIARALLKKSRILLFDEATSALDNVTQDEIQSAIKSISNDFTIITIAHRLSTIINSDKIYIVDDGKIIDSGKHDELLKRDSVYKELYREKR